jgi:predicted XRE-type DNA-binding protein
MDQNIWELFIDDPAHCAVMQIKSKLFMVVIQQIRESNMKQVDAAKLLGVSTRRISNLMKGSLDKFSIDTLVGMTSKVGYKVGTTFAVEYEGQPLSIILYKEGN